MTELLYRCTICSPSGEQCLIAATTLKNDSVEPDVCPFSGIEADWRVVT